MESEGCSSRIDDEPSATGISILADPKEPTLDIVFVHGFKGHPVRTWTHKTEYVTQDRGGSEGDSYHRPAKIPRLSAVKIFPRGKEDRKYVYWPRDLIPKTLPRARVLVYGYDTNIRHVLGSPVSKNTVYDIAFDFLQSLEAERRSHPSRPLVFIAHSLGGIVVKEVLLRSHGFTNHHAYLHQIYESTAAILFFGTPHGGADPRGLLESIAEKAIRAAGFTVNEDVVKSLLPTSERLRELRDVFAPMARQNGWIIHSFQEQYGIQFLQGKKVVEDPSSCLGDSLEMTQHIASNHMKMCRFGGFDDVEYRKVVAALERVQMRITEGSVASPSQEMSFVLDEKYRKYYLNSLWYPAIDSRHATIKTAHNKTCKWFLQKPEYRDWLDVDKTADHHGFLWIRGKPGSGKSTLMKFAVANTRKIMKETIIISFFFNARGEDLEKSTLGMYRSILFQILTAIPDLQIIFDSLRSTAPLGESYTWHEDTLQTLFSVAIKSLGQRHLICFIDALDECDEGQMRDLVGFLEQLSQVAVSVKVNFHVGLSSRHYPHVSIRSGIEMTLQDQEGHSQDISKYVSSELRIGHRANSKAINEEIVERSSGIFLWVALVVQILNKEYDHGRLHSPQKRLKEIPDGLDKLFEDILMRDQQNQAELLLCLQLILYARRPLKREEIYHAILYETDSEALSESNAEEITTQDMERFVLSCSKGLAETTKLKAQTVQFIHESVRDFLLGKNGLSKLKLELGLGLSHDRLKLCCYKHMKINTPGYLPFPLPNASSKEAKRLRDSSHKNFPFLEYAVHHVLYHADVADGQDISQEVFLNEFDLTQWITLDNVFEKYEVRRHTPSASLLYLVAEKNLSNLVRTQLKYDKLSGTVIDHSGGGRYAAPFYAALANENVDEDTIRLLLDLKTRTLRDQNEILIRKSDDISDCIRAASRTLFENRLVISKLRKGRELEDWAATNGHEALVNIFFAFHDTDPNAQDKLGRTLIFRAAEFGQAGVVRFLLEQKHANPHTKDRSDKTPLAVAAERGHHNVVQVFLTQENIDPNSKDMDSPTPLSRAAASGHTEVVRLLLTRDSIDPDSQDLDGQTPLSRAADSGHTDVVNLLLTHNKIDPDSRDAYGHTPLSRAAASGHTEVVRLLLTRDSIDPESQDLDGETPLLRAAAFGYAEVVRLLLAQGNIDPDLKDKAGRTPLSVATAYGHKEIALLLLAQDKVDPQSKDNEGGTPLLRAAAHGRGNVVRVLLEQKNVNPDPQDIYGITPLLSAAGSHENVVQLLLAQERVNVMKKDVRGKTALLIATRNENEAILRLLLKHERIDPNCNDDAGKTPLLDAADSGSKGIVRLLLAHKNIDPNYKNDENYTPLSQAAYWGNEGVVRLLLAHESIDVEKKIVYNETALSLAQKRGHEGVVRLLLQAKEDINSFRNHVDG